MDLSFGKATMSSAGSTIPFSNVSQEAPGPENSLNKPSLDSIHIIGAQRSQSTWSKQVQFEEPVETVLFANGRTLPISRKAVSDVRCLDIEINRQFKTLKKLSGQWFRFSATPRTGVLTRQLLDLKQSKPFANSRIALQQQLRALLHGFGPETLELTPETVKRNRKQLSESTQNALALVDRLQKLQALNPLGPYKHLRTMQQTLEQYQHALQQLFPEG